MKICEYKVPNQQWNVIEFTCEKTGISIQKFTMNIQPKYIIYKIKDGDNNYDIMEELFELIKKLIV